MFQMTSLSYIKDFQGPFTAYDLGLNLRLNFMSKQSRINFYWKLLPE